MELIDEKVQSGESVEKEVIDEVFGEIFEEEYVEMTQRGGGNQGVEVDFVIEGVLLDTDPRVKLMNEVDT